MLPGSVLFTVKARNLTAVATGTQFDVQDYRDSTTSGIVLTEGLLDVSCGKRVYHLDPHMQIRIDNKSEHAVLRDVVEDQLPRWMSQLRFEEIPLEYALHVISKYFGVTIDMSGEALPDGKFTAVFEQDPSLDKVLFTLQNTTPQFNYEIDGNTVRITKNKSVRQSSLCLCSDTSFYVSRSLPFFVYLLSFATLSAQEVRIVLSGTELPARDLFIQIERQTVYRFAYNSAVFDASQVINLPAAELSLREILDRVTEISRVTCLVHQDMVIIGPGKEEVPPPVIPPGIGRPPAVEDPETGDRYIATDIRSLSALSRPDRSLPLDKSEPVQVIQVVVEPESGTASET